MSDMDGSYGQSSLATMNLAYNNPKINPVQPLNGSRRPSRTTYKPSAGPPPASALPAPPSNMQQYTQQHIQPLRLQPVASNIANHPYSAQPYALTPDSGSDLEEGFSSANEGQNRHIRRPPAHTSGPLSSSQAQGLNISARQASASSLDSYSELPYHYPSPTTRVSPGSYFAAYPPTALPTARDRSGSNVSDISVDTPSHQGSNTDTPPASGPSSISFSQTHSSSQPIPQAASTTSSQSKPQSTSHRTRPSSRKALTAALELAKSAVQIDATNDDPHGAVLAYAKSVQLLSEVMERVMRGEDTSGPTSTNTSSAASSSTITGASSGGEAEDKRRTGRRRSVVAKEEEVRRLKAIHDTYADRMKILCLIYSIPDPLPSKNHTPSASSTAPLHLAERHATTTGAPPAQVAPMESTTESLAEKFPDAPEDVNPEDNLSKDMDTVTIRRGHQPNVASQDWEVDSDWERRGLTRDRPRNRERDNEASTTGYHLSQQQSPVTDEVPPSATINSRPLYAMGPPRSVSQDAVASVTTPTSSSLSALRNSVLPPPRPPPSGPLPSRPRMPSGSGIPPQLLNQPLPPLPPPQKVQNLPEPNSIQTTQQTITRQSSSSSFSATSGASSTASGSSAASNLLSQNGSTNLLPNNLPASTSITMAALAASAGSTVTGRPRGNSVGHGRNLSNAERLVAVNEEKEEEESGSKTSTNSVTPPVQEYKYRSRSSSMVSLKDRDRARAQVLGTNGPLPPIPPTPASSSSPTATPTTTSAAVPLTPRRVPPEASSTDAIPLPSPNSAVFGSKATPRPRGNSVGSTSTRMSEDYINNGSSPSTTPIAGGIPYTAGGVPAPGSAPIVIPGAIGASSDTEAVKINSSPSLGTISQRRQKNSFTGSTPGSSPVPLPSLPTSITTGHTKLTSAVLPASTATSLGLTSRNRAASNPGKWPASIVHMSMGETTARPPMPLPPMSAGPRRQFQISSAARYQPFGIPSPGANASTVSLVSGAAIAGSPASAPPPPPPTLSVLRPYHLMSLLRKSMTDRSGGYVTARLHVPHEVWTQGSAKLTNSAEKTKVVDVLVTALDELATASIEFCGTASGITAATGGDGDRKQAEKWAVKLEEFDRAFRTVGETFGKKLGVGGGFVAKKSVGMTAWSSKMFDKITTVGKAYDSPIQYANLLARFFAQVQLLDEHTRAFSISPQPRSYASLPPDVRTRIDTSLKSISELFAKVVLTFVFRDLSLMLDKYHKTCDRWIQSNPGTQT